MHDHSLTSHATTKGHRTNLTPTLPPGPAHLRHLRGCEQWVGDAGSVEDLGAWATHGGLPKVAEEEGDTVPITRAHKDVVQLQVPGESDAHTCRGAHKRKCK